MSNDKKVELGDHLAPEGPYCLERLFPSVADAIDAEKPHTEGSDRSSFEIVAALAIRYSVPFEELAAEVKGKGTLAKIARDLLGWPQKEKPLKGRPPKTEEKWREFVFIELCKAEYGGLAPAIREYIRRGNLDEGSFDKLRRRHERAASMWSTGSLPLTIVDMFASPPCDSGHSSSPGSED